MTFLQNQAVKELKLLRGLRGCHCANVSSGLKAAKSLARALLMLGKIILGLQESPAPPWLCLQLLVTSERERRARKKGRAQEQMVQMAKLPQEERLQRGKCQLGRETTSPFWRRSSFPLIHKTQKFGSTCNWKATG